MLLFFLMDWDLVVSFYSSPVNSLSTGAIVGIVIGSIFGLILLFLLCKCLASGTEVRCQGTVVGATRGKYILLRKKSNRSVDQVSPK